MNSVFDLQVLVAIQEARKHNGGDLMDSDISNEGNWLFGSDWDKPAVWNKFPKICFALGRLRKAGLIEGFKPAGDTVSSWDLTDQGKNVLNAIDIDQFKKDVKP